jgi:hypothetical protein
VQIPVELGRGDVLAAVAGIALGIVAVLVFLACRPRAEAVAVAPAVEEAEPVVIPDLPPAPNPGTRTAPYCEAAADGTLRIPRDAAPRVGVMVLPFGFVRKSDYDE